MPSQPLAIVDDIAGAAPRPALRPSRERFHVASRILRGFGRQAAGRRHLDPAAKDRRKLPFESSQVEESEFFAGVDEDIQIALVTVFGSCC